MKKINIIKYCLITLFVSNCALMQKQKTSSREVSSVTQSAILNDSDTIAAPKSINNQLWAFEPLPNAVQAKFYEEKISSNVLVDPDYWTWGASIFKWKDGKYHAYYSRWKKETSWLGWLTDCEIAHGVSDKPEGPYTFVNVIVESRNKDGWESATAHNPSVCVVDGTIYLYYISVDLDEVYKESEETYPVSKWIKDYWNVARNRQKIGLVTATNPSGPFIRTPQPVVKPHDGPFKNIAVNPAVTFADEKFTMIMKGDDLKHDEVFRIQLSGQSDKAEGPFVFEEQPVYDKAQTEDASVWHNKLTATYYMVCHVVDGREMIFLSSKDGKKWVADKNPLFIKKEIVLENGQIWKPQRMERPFVLTDEQGQALMLFVAVKDKGVSGTVAIPFKKDMK
ncbi:MAG: glycoside hydrolase family protein [Flavobacteriaceae bacterium]